MREKASPAAGAEVDKTRTRSHAARIETDSAAALHYCSEIAFTNRAPLLLRPPRCEPNSTNTLHHSTVGAEVKWATGPFAVRVT